MGLSGHHCIYVAKAIKHHVCHLKAHNAPISTLLAHVYTGARSRTTGVTTALITRTLWVTVKYLGADLGFLPSEVSARSLRAAGAMALLVANFNPDIIQIL